MTNRCNEIMAAMATGGPFRRWRAMRHAARCPRCAAARDELRQVARALAEVAPLNDAQRRIWTAAAITEFRAEPARGWWLRPAMAGALAAFIFIGVGAWWMSRPHTLRPGSPDVATVDPRTVKQESLDQMEGLRGDVVALGREIDDLRHRADLLDARKDVEALVARLAPKGQSSGL